MEVSQNEITLETLSVQIGGLGRKIDSKIDELDAKLENKFDELARITNTGFQNLENHIVSRLSS